MKYEKNTWNTYTWDEAKTREENLLASRDVDAAITKAKMENIEDGIERAHNQVEVLEEIKANKDEVNALASDKASKVEHDQLVTDFSAHQTEVAAQLAQITTLVTKYSNLVVNGDWTNAIQQAVNDASENQEIHFPIGEYTFSNIAINKPIKITGKGTLKKKHHDDMLFIIDFVEPCTHKRNTFEMKDVTIDGNEQDVVSEKDLIIKNVGVAKFTNVTFKNPSKASVFIQTNVDKAIFDSCNFYDGMYKSSTGEGTATFHIQNWASCELTVTNCSFETDIIFDGGDGTAEGTIKTAPIAIYSINAIQANVHDNRFNNSGHIDLYSANHVCSVRGNKFTKCHYPAIKVQESRDTLIHDNSIKDNLCEWGYAIIVQGYARAKSYGLLEPKQYYGVISKNEIIGSETGGIMISGTRISSDITERDPSITRDLTVYGYNITGNKIRNVKQTGIFGAYIADSSIFANQIFDFGLGTATPDYNRTGIALQKPKGIIKIDDNIIIGDGVNSKHCIRNNYDGLTSADVGSVVKIKGNYTKGTINYPIFLRYIESVEVINNHCYDDFSTLIYVGNSNFAKVIDNTGFDLSAGAGKITLTNIANKITDYQRLAKNIYYDSAPPTSGTYYKNDEVINRNKLEQGVVGDKYIIEKWICTVAGTPGTWVEFRGFTGN